MMNSIWAVPALDLHLEVVEVSGIIHLEQPIKSLRTILNMFGGLQEMYRKEEALQKIKLSS